ncbi:MAG: BTAD domain-containing putative transcriptional regulator [Gemmatimonadaceae bacterium]
MGTLLSIETFGRLSAYTADGAAVSAPRRLALLALLAAAGDRGLSRDKVIAYLWPESPAEKARHALEQLLYALRREAGGELFVNGNPLRLDPGAVRSDISEFDDALAAGELERAVSLYGGPFLDGFFISDAPEFERWVDGERSRLAKRYTDTLEQLARAAGARGEHGRAAEWWRRRAEIDPYDSRVALELMKGLAAAGNPAGALLHAQAHESLLRQELDAAPHPSVSALAEELRALPSTGAGAVAVVSAPATPSQPATRDAEALKAASHGPQVAAPSRRRRVIAGAIWLGGLATVVLGYVTLYLPTTGSGRSLIAAGRLGERERILVADFRVGGTDSLLGSVAAEAIRADLDQSDVVAVATPATVAAVLQRMQRSPASRVDLPLAREIAAREGLKAIVHGDVVPLGTGFVVTLRLLSADSGSILASFEGSADLPGELIPTLGKLSRRLRGRIGESLSAVQAGPPLERVTTSSLEALRQYATGVRAFGLGEYQKAVRLLEDAVSIDSTFAMAYRKLAFAVSNSGLGYGRFAEVMTKAYRYRHRLTDRERYLTTADYYRSVVGDRPKAIAAFESLLERYPDEAVATSNFAANLTSRREFARAEALLRRNVSRRYADLTDHRYLVRTQVNQGKLAAAESTARHARQRFPDAEGVELSEAAVMIHRGQLDSVEIILRPARAAREPSVRIGALNTLANLALLRGKLAEAERIRAEATAANVARGGRGWSLEPVLSAARTDVLVRGNPARAVDRLDDALTRVSNQAATAGIVNAYGPRLVHAYLEIANAYATSGRPERARRLLARFDATADSAEQRVSEAHRHETLAEIAAAERRPVDAIREFRLADREPDGPADQCTFCLPLRLGRAFDIANMPDSAIAMYERYIATPHWARLVPDGWYLARIYERLGELYEARGDPRRAGFYYAKFVDLWKGADAELQPRVSEARRRLARLSGSPNPALARATAAKT